MITTNPLHERSPRQGRVFATLALTALTSCAAPARAETPQTTSSAATPRLRFETVRSILHDSKGDLWFGSWNEGVARFDGTSLTYFTAQDGLGHDQIRSIYEDKNGVVWFEGGVGMRGFDGEKFLASDQRDYTRKDQWSLGDGDLWFKDEGEMGANAQEGQPGVYRYDGTTFTYHAYPLPLVPKQIPAYATTGFARGKRGRVWFATYGAVFGFDGTALTTLDDERMQRTEANGRMHCRCVFEDRRGNLWIGNNGIGVLLWDGTNVTDFTQLHGLGKPGRHAGRITPLPGDVVGDGPSLHRVFSIGEDRDGNVWFGTVESGAWRYDGTTVRHFGAEEGLTTNDVFGIYRDRNDDLWLAGHGVFRWNGTSFERVF